MFFQITLKHIGAKESKGSTSFTFPLNGALEVRAELAKERANPRDTPYAHLLSENKWMLVHKETSSYRVPFA